MLPDPHEIVRRLRDLQRRIRTALIAARSRHDLHEVDRSTSADTIYRLDAEVEPILEAFFDEWSREYPIVVLAEGLEPDTGRVFPAHASDADAPIRILLDPIDGTRGLMYDKRSAWSLAGVAPNRGPSTRLRDVHVAVMTELPTSKMNQSDVLFAVKGRGATGIRETLPSAPVPRGRATLVSPPPAAATDPASPHDTPEDVPLRESPNLDSPISESPLPLRPSTSPTLTHGFASVANFFPGTKVLASSLMEELVRELLGERDATGAEIFDDQYISTGGQFYELIVGHDRFNADLRPIFYRIQSQSDGFACHPYDAATALVAEEAGVLLTDALGHPLDAPFDLTSPVSWIAYANPTLRARIEPVLHRFLRRHGIA